MDALGYLFSFFSLLFSAACCDAVFLFCLLPKSRVFLEHASSFSFFFSSQSLAAIVKTVTWELFDAQIASRTGFLFVFEASAGIDALKYLLSQRSWI